MPLLNYKELKIDAHQWKGSALGSECSLHQLSPYIGKMKSSMASSLVESFSSEGDFIYDPFWCSGFWSVTTLPEALQNEGCVLTFWAVNSLHQNVAIHR